MKKQKGFSLIELLIVVAMLLNKTTGTSLTLLVIQLSLGATTIISHLWLVL